MSYGLKRRPDTETIRDAALIYKNFSGEKKKFNPEGDRNFCIMMDEETAAQLQSKGWHIKPVKKREGEEDQEQYYYLKVAVAYQNRPPRAWLITSGGRTLIGEGMISMFDKLDSVRVDLVISAYDWTLPDSGASGRKAYLQSMFFTMYEDELEIEYADIPQMSAVGEGSPREIEPGSRQAYEYDGEIED